MAVKDKYGNNIRNGERVKDADGRHGKIVGTNEPQAFVLWDDGEEETVRGVDLQLEKKRLGR